MLTTGVEIVGGGPVSTTVRSIVSDAVCGGVFPLVTMNVTG